MYKDLINKIKPLFESEGFFFVKSLNGFRKKIGQADLRFEINNSIHGIEISIDYGIQFKIIEELLYKLYEIKMDSRSKTIFIGGVSYLGVDGSRFFITTEEKTENAIREISKIFHIHAMPYFENYNTLEALNELINGEPIEENKIGNGKFHGATLDSVFRGLITAKLLDRSDFPVLEEYYRTFMVERSRRLAEHLKEKSLQRFETYLERFHEIDFDRYRKKIEQSA